MSGEKSFGEFKKKLEPAEHPAPAPVQEEPVVPQEPATPVLQVLSEEDAYIADRTKSGPQTLDDVLMVKEKRYAPGEHRLSLPKEFKAYEDRFSFRWINKKKRAIDEAIIKGWIVVTRSLFPDVAENAKYLFSTSGAVEKGDTILSFMKKEIALAIRRAPGEKSSQILDRQLNLGKDNLPKEKSGFYKPKTSDADNDETGPSGNIFQEGRDF